MKNTIVFCVSVLIGLLIVEFGLRAFDPVNFQALESRDLAVVSLVTINILSGAFAAALKQSPILRIAGNT